MYDKNIFLLYDTIWHNLMQYDTVYTCMMQFHSNMKHLKYYKLTFTFINQV